MKKIGSKSFSLLSVGVENAQQISSVFEQQWQKGSVNWENYIDGRGSAAACIESVLSCVECVKDQENAGAYGLLIESLVRLYAQVRATLSMENKLVIEDFISDLWVRWRFSALNPVEVLSESLYEEDLKLYEGVKSSLSNGEDVKRPHYKVSPFGIHNTIEHVSVMLIDFIDALKASPLMHYVIKEELIPEDMKKSLHLKWERLYTLTQSVLFKTNSKPLVWLDRSVCKLLNIRNGENLEASALPSVTLPMGSAHLDAKEKELLLNGVLSLLSTFKEKLKDVKNNEILFVEPNELCLDFQTQMNAYSEHLWFLLDHVVSIHKEDKKRTKVRAVSVKKQPVAGRKVEKREPLKDALKSIFGASSVASKKESSLVSPAMDKEQAISGSSTKSQTVIKRGSVISSSVQAPRTNEPSDGIGVQDSAKTVLDMSLQEDDLDDLEDLVWVAFKKEAPIFVSELLSLLKDAPKESKISGALMRVIHSLHSLGATAQVLPLERLAQNLENWCTPYFDAQQKVPVNHWDYVQKVAQEIHVCVKKALENTLNEYEPHYEDAEWLGLQEFGASDSIIETEAPSVVPDAFYGATAMDILSTEGIPPLEENTEQEPNAVQSPVVAPVSSFEFSFEDSPEDAKVVQSVSVEVLEQNTFESLMGTFLQSEASESLDGGSGALEDMLGSSLEEGIATIGVQPQEELEGLNLGLDFDILPGFLMESEELMDYLEQELKQFNARKQGAFVAINRHVHTLKGGSRMVGAKFMADLLHELEERTTLEHSNEALNKEIYNLVRSKMDTIYGQLNDLKKALVEHQNEEIKAQSRQELGPDVSKEEHLAPTERISVETSVLSNLGALVLENTQIHQRIEKKVALSLEEILEIEPISLRLDSIASNIMLEAETKISSSMVKKSTFDALEFDSYSALHEYTRRLQEAVSDMSNISNTVQEHLESAQESLRASSYLDRDISSQIRDLSRAPFSTIESRLRALVRQSAFELKKKALLVVRGAKVTFERSTLDKVVPVLEHLLRNAVAHGVETPEERKRAGKEEDGTISVLVVNDGNHIQISVSDDGGGVNLKKVHQKAQQKGLLGEQASEKEILGVLFAPGFSTAEQVNQIAGRGVGLDVVAESVGLLGGRVSLEQQTGKGASFIIRIPQSTSLMTGVAVYVNNSAYVIPAGLIKTMSLVDHGEFEKALASQKPLSIDGQSVEPFWFGTLIGKQKPKSLNKKLYQQVLVLHESKIAFGADRFEYITGLSIKAFKEKMYQAEGLIGYSLLPSGEVAIGVNPARLAKFNLNKLLPTVGPKETKEPLVLVVDDSVTIRSVTQKMLIKSGYRAQTAENGSVALLRCGQERPDLILMDIEMPVMDGFEATVALRSDDHTKDIPIFMISSRSAQKHLDYAKGIGVNEFFGKPYDKEEILSTIARYLKEK